MLKVQFNKTYLLQIEKALKIRWNALPVLEAKEAAIRAEVKKISDKIALLEQELNQLLKRFSTLLRLWPEMPDLVKVKEIQTTQRLVAGIKVSSIKNIEFEIKDYSLFSQAGWIPGGIQILKQIIAKKINIHLQKGILIQMEIARRKTTQKVNLYKKVQIPEFEEAIRKIKRFLEDEDTLSKSSQKILKSRMAMAEL